MGDRMTINHDSVLIKVSDYLSNDEGVFYSIRDLFDLVPFDEEDNATLHGLCFTLGNIVVGEPKDDPHYKGLKHLYKMVLYSGESTTKSYISFQKDSKSKKRDFLAFTHERDGEHFKTRKFRLYENGEINEKEISVFNGDFE